MASLTTTFFPLLTFVLLICLLSSCEAKDFLVDGKTNSWKIPSSPDEFNKWAENTRFQIGDSLVLEYDSKSDSVLEVKEEDYKNCNKAKPIKSFNDGDGNTRILLNRSGPFYFISGTDGHCELGQKLQVEVMSCKHGSKCPSPAQAPPPSKLQAPAPEPAGPASAGHGLRAGSVVGLVLLIVGCLVG